MSNKDSPSIVSSITPDVGEGTSSSVKLNGNGLIRKRRIRFSKAWDVLLLKTILVEEAHLARHGEAQNRFEDVLKRFIPSIPDDMWHTTTKPTWKSLNDRYKKIISDHRTATRANLAASGIVEERGEREQLLDDILLIVNENEEERRAERDERTEMDRRLKSAGEQIRNQAVGEIEHNNELPLSPPSSSNSAAVSASMRIGFESDDDERRLLDEHIKRMSEYEARRLKIEEERNILQRNAENNVNDRYLRDKQLSERRLLLEEKRFELSERRHHLDSEDRKTFMSERKEMSGLLLALTMELKKKSNNNS